MIVENVPLKDLRPSKDQIRVTFDEEALDALALSIKEQGQEVPIKVRRNGKGYEIVYGHRRTEASRRAGLETIAAIVEDVDDSEALLKQVLENECREDVDVVEKARGYANLLEKLGCSQTELAQMVGCTQPTINRSMQALKGLDNGVVVHNSDGKISLRKTAIAMAAKGDWEAKRKIADKFTSEELNLGQTEEVLAAHNAASSARERSTVIKVRHPKRRDFSFEQELRATSMDADRKSEKRRSAEITDEPIVKYYMDAMTAYRDAIKEASESPARFSPEAIRFTTRRHSIITKEIIALDEVLSNV